MSDEVVSSAWLVTASERIETWEYSSQIIIRLVGV